MKRYIKSDANTKYLYKQLDEYHQDYALTNFIWYMRRKYGVDLSEYDAQYVAHKILWDSNTAFDENGYTVDKNGNVGDIDNEHYILPNNWKDYITNNSISVNKNW